MFNKAKLKYPQPNGTIKKTLLWKMQRRSKNENENKIVNIFKQAETSSIY